jgi:hypothetical protein
MPGIITSSTTMSGGSAATAARQEGPSGTPVTSNPSPSRKASSIPRMPSSSSQTRIFGLRADTVAPPRRVREAAARPGGPTVVHLA